MGCSAICGGTCSVLGLSGCVAGCAFGVGILSAPGATGSVASAAVSATTTATISSK